MCRRRWRREDWRLQEDRVEHSRCPREEALQRLFLNTAPTDSMALSTVHETPEAVPERKHAVGPEERLRCLVWPQKPPPFPSGLHLPTEESSPARYYVPDSWSTRSKSWSHGTHAIACLCQSKLQRLRLFPQILAKS